MRQARDDRVLRLGQAEGERAARAVEPRIRTQVRIFDRVHAVVIADARVGTHAALDQRRRRHQFEDRRRRRPRLERQVGGGLVRLLRRAPGHGQHAPVLDREHHRRGVGRGMRAQEALDARLHRRIERQLRAPPIGQHFDVAAAFLAHARPFEPVLGIFKRRFEARRGAGDERSGRGLGDAIAQRARHRERAEGEQAKDRGEVAAHLQLTKHSSLLRDDVS